MSRRAGMIMSDASLSPWEMLPGPKWSTPLQARNWLVEKRRSLGWSHKDLAKAFSACAALSDLYICSGGGVRFDRATEKRIARFEQDGERIPDWVYWMPLAIQHAQVSLKRRRRWERVHIPQNSTVRREREDADYESRLLHLDDEEIALIARFREMGADERDFLRFVVGSRMLAWWIDTVKRADACNTDLVEIIENALSFAEHGVR